MEVLAARGSDRRAHWGRRWQGPDPSHGPSGAPWRSASAGGRKARPGPRRPPPPVPGSFARQAGRAAGRSPARAASPPPAGRASARASAAGRPPDRPRSAAGRCRRWRRAISAMSASVSLTDQSSRAAMSGPRQSAAPGRTSGTVAVMRCSPARHFGDSKPDASRQFNRRRPAMTPEEFRAPRPPLRGLDGGLYDGSGAPAGARADAAGRHRRRPCPPPRPKTPSRWRRCSRISGGSSCPA